MWYPKIQFSKNIEFKLSNDVSQTFIRFLDQKITKLKNSWFFHFIFFEHDKEHKIQIIKFLKITKSQSWIYFQVGKLWTFATRHLKAWILYFLKIGFLGTRMIPRFTKFEEIDHHKTTIMSICCDFRYNYWRLGYHHGTQKLFFQKVQYFSFYMPCLMQI